ncbi:unnamed protein product [Cyclocybe aegerita]|uniref:RING-type domain-containing protein n=1 Tax=Cyclocybe aegerita TaxID=1973307 RepID=A0A8S0XNM8_CYCAE|nr:unnamed protein product [Cyclocybe aegerita]
MRQPPKNVVIEIESSPEPPSPPIHPRSLRARSPSKTPARSVGHAGTSAKGKGKARAPSRTVKAMGPVIELTDSDSDEVVPVTPKPAPGPSNPKTLRPNPAGTSTSQENIGSVAPTSSRQKRKLPLFLQSQSDEENEPPMFRLDMSSSLAGLSSGGRSAKRVHRSEKEREDKGKGKATAVGVEDGPVDHAAPAAAEGEDAVDWDADFWNKPFPFMMDGYGLAEPEPVRDPTPHPQVIEPIQPPAPVRVPLPQPQAPQPLQLVAQPVPVPPAPVAEPVPEPFPEPPPEPTLEDLASQVVAQVLEIIPDVEPTHLLELVRPEVEAYGVQGCVERVVGALFEQAGGYPKVEKSKPGQQAGESKQKDGGGQGSKNGKERQRDEEPEGAGREAKRVKVDYASVERVFEGGVRYFDAALTQLQADFPFIPKPYLRRQLQAQRSLYAPTHLKIAAEERELAVTRDRRPYTLKATAYKALKGKGRAVVDEAFEKERRWLVAHLEGREAGDEEGAAEPQVEVAADKGKGKEKAADEEPPLEEGEGIECQCCFSEYRFDKMVQCPEAHLFCDDCVSQYAATKLGEHDVNVVCMHSSGCAQPFPTSELRRVLTETLMSLYERIKQQKEIEAAGIEGLEECPFCEWKCVIEASREEEKLFRCGNEDGGCGVVSCRECKKPDHLPKSCKEVEEDKHLDGRHAIEEAMTRALMRNCPKCNKAFVKDAGCNKMTCPHCRTLSCYVCRKVINGYEHFNQNPPGRPSTSQQNGKCLLWDQVEERHAAEVKAAAEKALADWKRDHPDVDEENVKVDIPKAVPQPAPAPAVAMPGVVGLPHGYHIAINFGAHPHAVPPNAIQIAANNAMARMYGAAPAQPPVPVVPPVPAARRGRRQAPRAALAAAQEANRQYLLNLEEAERRRQRGILDQQRQQQQLFEAGQRAIQRAQEVADANARFQQQILAEQNRLRLEAERQQQEQREQEQARERERGYAYQRLVEIARADEARKREAAAKIEAANNLQRDRARMYADAMRRDQEARQPQLQALAQNHGYLHAPVPQANVNFGVGVGVGQAGAAAAPFHAVAAPAVRTRAQAQANAGAQAFQLPAQMTRAKAAAVVPPPATQNPFVVAAPPAPQAGPARAKTNRRQAR